MDFVAVDLGASGSRYVTDCGQISVLSNNMVVLPNNELSSITPDATDIESCLEVQIVKETGAECNHFPANVLIGIRVNMKHINASTANNFLCLFISHRLLFP